jgi:hypothetical protein
MFTALRIVIASCALTGIAIVSGPDERALAAGEPSCAVFPADNPWNTDISSFPVHPQSDAFVNSVGRTDHLHPDFGTVWNGAPIGIPYVIVPGAQQKVPVSFDYADESDPGPYPVPPDAPIEGGPDSGGDRHVLVIDNDNCVLYEMFDAHPVNGGQSWNAGSGAVFNLNSNVLRPDFWTSADAAGLPIFPGLVRYEEVVEQGVIDHALRFTVSTTQRAFIHPATHFASSNTDPNVPPMGLRFRMKASYNCGGFSAEVQAICAALKRYGMFVADNGSDWYISGAPDPRWSDDRLGDLKAISGDAFEVVATDGDAPPPPEPLPPPPPPPVPAPAPVVGEAPVPPVYPTLEVAAPSSPSPARSPSPTQPGLPTRTMSSTPIPTEQGGPSSGGGPSAAMIGVIAFSVLSLSGAGAGYYWYHTRKARAAPATEL